MDPNIPYNFTGASAEQALLQAIFGNGPLGSMIAQYGTPFINRMLGLEGPDYRSALLDTTLMSNMTPYGIYRSNMQNQINRVANAALTQQTNAAKRRWIEDITRTTMSFDSWRTEQASKGITYDNTTEARDAYDAWVSNSALGHMSNPLWSMGYTALDPDGLLAANTYLQQAGANQIRFGRNKGIRTAMAHARAVGNLFKSDANFTYDRNEFGYMDIGESSAVAAALTKDLDFFGTATSAEDIKGKAEALRKKVQDYTKALSPLKDVFGKDVPGMIKAVEDLSGKSFSRLSAQQISNMTSTIMASAAVGGYTLGDVVNVGSQIRSAIGQMNVPFYNELGAQAQALATLNMTNQFGLTPAYMSDMRYRENASKWVMRTSNSSGAGYLNAAAAVWLDRKENEGKTFDDFRKAYEAMRTQYDATEAMMQMTGTGSLYELEVSGRQSAKFQEAVKADIGGRISRWESLEDLIEAGRGMSTNREAYDEAIAALSKNPYIMNDEDALKQSGLSEEAIKQVRDISAGMGMGALGESFVSAIFAKYNYEQTQPQIERQQKLQANLSKLKTSIPSGAKGAVRDFLSGKLSLSSLLQSRLEIDMADEDTKKMVDSIGNAMKQFSSNLYTGKSPEEQAKFASEQLAYGFLNGPTNLQYMNALERYEAATNDKDRATAGLDMYLASKLDEEALTEYVGEGDDAEKNRDSLRTRYAAAEKQYRSTHKEYTIAQIESHKIQEVSDLISYKGLEKVLGANSKYSGFLTEALEAAEQEGDFSYATVKKIAEKQKAVLNDKEEEFLNNTINGVFGKEGSANQDIKDLFDKIGELLTAMTTLTQNIQPLLTAAGVKPENSTTAPAVAQVSNRSFGSYGGSVVA